LLTEKLIKVEEYCQKELLLKTELLSKLQDAETANVLLQQEVSELKEELSGQGEEKINLEQALEEMRSNEVAIKEELTSALAKGMEYEEEVSDVLLQLWYLI
jgi:FtsZ-binding cell division protein ZapB